MKDVYQQVLITCTTINVLILLSTLFTWVSLKISDHRRKKKENAKKHTRDKNE